MAQEENYRSMRGHLSQSSCKDWRYKSPKQWKKIWLDGEQDPDKKDSTFVFGDLLDTMMFTPHLLEQRFYIGELKIPSDAVASIISATYDMTIKDMINWEGMASELPPDCEIPSYITLEDSERFLLIAAENYEVVENGVTKRGWQNNWGADAKIKNLIKQGEDYFESLKKAAGRRIISTSTNMQAIELRDILLADEFTRGFFIEQENETLFHQLEIFTQIEGIPVKGAIDDLRMYHKEELIDICDFKTSFSSYNFIESIKKYGYCDQLSFYKDLVIAWLEEYEQGKYSHYKIRDCLNLVIDPKEKTPYPYYYKTRDLNIAKYGNKSTLYDIYKTDNHNQKIKIGWLDVLHEINWHIQNDKWDKPKELYETGRITVDLLNG